MRLFLTIALSWLALALPACAQSVSRSVPYIGGAFANFASASQNIFGSATPTYATGSDGPYNLGTRFQATANGQITAARFYKDASMAGETHIAYLFSNTGTQLATFTFSGETASGWQQQNFPSPVSVTAGATYMVAICTGAHYLATAAYAFPQFNSQNLYGTNGNGWFSTGACGTFPTTSTGYNYWVDVVFTATGLPGACAMGSSYADGCPGANANSNFINPSLLAGESFPPPWNVPGVNYRVGYDTTTTLKVPGVDALPGCASFSGGTVNINSNNCTLTGWNFSGDGIQINGVTGATITNCKMVSSASYIYALPGSDNLTITFCDLDIQGGGGTIQGGLISNRGGGTFTLQYNRIANSGGDLVQFQGASGTLVAQYNYFDTAGLASGAHGDWTQFIGSPYGGTETFNVGTQTGGTSQGFMWEPDITPCTNALAPITFSNNIVLGAASYMSAVTVCDLPGSPVPAYTSSTNYFDISQSFGFTPGGSRGGVGDGSTATGYTGNVNMITGDIYGD